MTTPNRTAKHPLSAVILAGGQGQRMGNSDKGLLLLCQRPLIHWTIQRLTPQVEHIIINANRHTADYKKLGHPIVSDATDKFLGPLAGMQAGLAACQHSDWVLFVPCDSPFFPTDLAQKLHEQALAEQADIAVACVGGYPQPVFSLVKTHLLSHLTAFIQQEQKIMRWFCQHRLAKVAFSDADAFQNINTAEELAQAEQRIGLFT